MKLTKGTILKARGGWDAEVVWVARKRSDGWITIEGFYAIHKPGTDNESGPTAHRPNGVAVGAGTKVYEPPVYSAGHPADLWMGEYEL